MKNFVGKGIHLVIKESDGAFQVHTIEIMQKTDDSCPVKDIGVGEYFLHLVASSPQGKEASIVCNWSDDLLQNLASGYKDAKDANYSQITMFRDPQNPDENRWLLSWGDNTTKSPEQKPRKKDPIGYVR